eukprot:TRINITY_DN776453_c0_g1_i1.p1 TRINITY_DN776453_c0_g1~~TRINITY_DN776453_c0_g1_i1.p1  ORF type:complete len:319 (-),score=47.96 TRINITY_DN776453_c0_g1_i1:131-1087(-)
MSQDCFLEVRPKDVLMRTNKKDRSKILLFSNSDSHSVFRVRTTNRKRFIVQPNHGCLLGNGNISVSVSKTLKEITIADEVDKLQFEAIEIEQSDFQKLQSMPKAVQSGAIKEMFAIRKRHRTKAVVTVRYTNNSKSIAQTHVESDESEDSGEDTITEVLSSTTPFSQVNMKDEIGSYSNTHVSNISSSAMSTLSSPQRNISHIMTRQHKEYTQKIVETRQVMKDTIHQNNDLRKRISEAEERISSNERKIALLKQELQLINRDNSGQYDDEQDGVKALVVIVLIFGLVSVLFSMVDWTSCGVFIWNRFVEYLTGSSVQ